MLRFHYYVATYDWWFEVDQVNVFGCYVPSAEPDIIVALKPYPDTPPRTNRRSAPHIANVGVIGLDWEIDEGCGTPVTGCR